MILMKYSVLVFALTVLQIDAARILAVYPTPSISHQVAFRPLTLELIKRGHEVVVLTTDPIFKEGEAPANLTEIDVHDLSYTLWRNKILSPEFKSGDESNQENQLRKLTLTVIELFEKQMSIDGVQKILKDKNQKFDLLLQEAYILPALGLSHVYDAPIIHISSFGPILHDLEITGAAMHPLLYPLMTHHKIYNLTLWEKFKELYYHFGFLSLIKEYEPVYEQVAQKIFGPLPSFNKLKENVALVFANIHPIWECNRPVPPNFIYIGGIHQKPEKELPKDLKSYLDSSKNGVIYLSFGTNVDPALLPPEKIQMIVKAFGKLPYDVLWKWDHDELPGRTKNIRISKWFPQSDLLRHPNVKLFVTQGGLQSSEEAITAGVPMIGIPLLADQWYNVEQYVYHKIGIQLSMETLTAELFYDSINEIINDDSYRENIKQLRTLLYDQPQSPLERAIWWTEYVLRHKGAKHLRAAGFNMSWAEYLELDLVLCVLSVLTSIFALITFISCKLYKALMRAPKTKLKSR